MVIIFVPVLGTILYLSLGRNRRKNKFFRVKRTREVQAYLESVHDYYQSMEDEPPPQISSDNLDLVRLIIKNSHFLPTIGNRVQILVDGPDTFRAIFDALAQAKSFIDIQYYILENGDLADRFARICRQKVAEGVEVRVLYDGVGSRYLSAQYITDLRKGGVQIHGFMPLRIWATTVWINYRNHRKIVVVDGKVAFLGGINVTDKYIKGDSHLGKWHDHHLRLEGPAVDSLHSVFAIDWNFVTGSDEMLKPRYYNHYAVDGSKVVQIVSSGPDSDFASIKQQYFKMINSAESYIYMANSYLIPGQSIVDALQTAALSGNDVRIMVPEKSDNVVVKWSIRSYFEILLEAGVKIYLYQEGFLHSKIMVADDQVFSLGTANLDNRSFEQNFEVNAVVYDRELAMELRDGFLNDCKKCVQLDLDTYRKRPVTDRLKEGLAKVWSPIL